MSTTDQDFNDWNVVDGYDNSGLYLNPVETDLLINALNSNKAKNAQINQNSTTFAENALNASTPTNGYLNLNTSDDWDWDLQTLAANPESYGAYPPVLQPRDSTGSEEGSDKASPDQEHEETGDKRKADSADEDEEGGNKRQETDSKGKKQTQKPGRKPLTSEPTTKRKAQNRAAQRAFRDRKEKHLKDLEDKVDELQKKSDTTTNENTVLKAQVDRLQTELTEYRKRLTNIALQTTSPFGTSNPSRNSWDLSQNFNFEFPKFGPSHSDSNKSRSVSAGQAFNASSASPATTTRSNSQSLFGDSFSTGSGSISKPVQNPSRQTSSRHNSSNTRQFSASNSASPASSGANGFTSSCVTTPEAISEISDKRKPSDAAAQPVNRTSFCEDFQTACGNTQNPVPKKPSVSQTRVISNDVPANTPGALTTTSTEASLDFGNFDFLANQNGGGFDPVLFGDYREPQESVMNGEGWFFNDAFTLPEFGSPLNQTNSQTQQQLPPKKDFMQSIEDTQQGKEPEVVPSEASQFLTCNTLWDRVQKSQKVVSGEADMDDLCSQLKSKAKCSGSGAVISQSDVDAILGPAAHRDTEPNYLDMFK